MRMKLIAALLVLCCFSFQLTAFADSQLQKVEFSQTQISVDSRANEFSLDILLTNNAAFSSAEFGLQLNGNIAIKKVTYNSAITGSAVNVLEKNGIQYFGFFDTQNKYNGKVNVCTVTFTYTGSAAASVTLKETSVTTITSNGGATKEVAAPNAIAQITRDSSGGTATPTPSASPSPTPAPGSDRTTVRIDPLTALTLIDQAKIDANGNKTVTLDVKKDAGTSSSLLVEFPASLTQTAEKRKLVIDTPLASITLPANVIAKAQLGSASTIGLVVRSVNTATLGNEAKSQIGSHPVLDLQFELDGKAVAWSNTDAPVSIAIPYAPSAAELANPDAIVVYYIDGQGSLHVVSNGHWDAATGKVAFQTNHFSEYGIAYAQKSFTDIQSSWAKKEIEALAVREIISGKTADTFGPNAEITRADFTKLLVGVLGQTAGKTGTPFKDVTSGAYYYDAVMTAKALGLASGSTGNLFEPKKPITRQDMMVLLDRALALSGQPLTSKASLASYKDAGKVSAYAKDSTAKLIAAGIIGGSDGELRPLDHLTRAEAAKVLYKLFGLLY